LLNREEPALLATRTSHELFTALGNLSWTAVLANNLAVLMMSTRAYDRAGQYLDECIAIYRTLGDEARAAHSLCVRGNMNFARGTLDHAERDFREAVPITRELGYPFGLSLAFNGLAILALLNGNRDEARLSAQESLAVIPHIPNAPDRMMQTVVVTTALILMDDAADPAGALAEIAPMVRRLPSNPYGWFFVIAVIHALAAQGDHRRAAEIAGTLHTKGALSAGFRRIIMPTLARVRDTLGSEAFDTAWQRGEAGPDFPELVQTLLNEFDPA
jgi:tetratricopeptide (TPR) repeat protein